ncbi:MAG: hypothetical protein FWH28_03495, partial [Clostridiales bacterium]|nr:hypothetical protein [Clostridiales bacterium]
LRQTIEDLFLPGAAWCSYMENVNITVTMQSSDYLSVLYSLPIVNGQIRFGIVMDMHSGKRLDLYHFWKDDSALKQALLDYEYSGEFSPPIDDSAAEDIILEAWMTESEYLYRWYQKYRDTYTSTIDLLRSKTSFYLQDNQLIITREQTGWSDMFFSLAP